jgi:ubiquitin-conjugating enzyme E2 J1
MSGVSARRIAAEVRDLARPSHRFTARPVRDDDLREWHFTLRGAPDSEFAGGLYHGRIQLPADYPLSPPSFYFITPSGRFETGVKICLSMSAFHPESWSPTWSIRTMLEALAAFMPQKAEGALGALDHAPEARRRLAAESVAHVCPLCGPVARLLLEAEPAAAAPGTPAAAPASPAATPASPAAAPSTPAEAPATPAPAATAAAAAAAATPVAAIEASLQAASAAAAAAAAALAPAAAGAAATAGGAAAADSVTIGAPSPPAPPSMPRLLMSPLPSPAPRPGRAAALLGADVEPAAFGNGGGVGGGGGGSGSAGTAGTRPRALRARLDRRATQSPMSPPVRRALAPAADELGAGAGAGTGAGAGAGAGVGVGMGAGAEPDAAAGGVGAGIDADAGAGAGGGAAGGERCASLECGRALLARRARCSACRGALYCGEACQRRDWPRHRALCAARQAAAAAQRVAAAERADAARRQHVAEAAADALRRDALARAPRPLAYFHALDATLSLLSLALGGACSLLLVRRAWSGAGDAAAGGADL